MARNAFRKCTYTDSVNCYNKRAMLYQRQCSDKTILSKGIILMFLKGTLLTPRGS